MCQHSICNSSKAFRAATVHAINARHTLNLIRGKSFNDGFYNVRWNVRVTYGGKDLLAEK